MRDLIAILFVACLLVPTAAAQAWPMEGGAPDSPGRVSIDGPDSLDPVIATNVGSQVLAQVVEGPASMALAGTVAGEVVAVSAAGNVVWRTDVGAPVRSAGLWTATMAVVVPQGDRAVALDGLGRELWRHPIGNDRNVDLVRMASPVEHPSGDVVLGDLQGVVHRLDPDGSVVWQAELGKGMAVEATPSIAPDGDVIVAAFTPGTEDAGRLFRLDDDTGEPVWERDLGSQVVGAVTIADQRLLVPLRDGRALEARSLSNGRAQWQVGFDDRLTASPSVHEGLAVVGDVRGIVRGIEVASGRVAWTFNPLQSDPNADHLVGGSTALAVADAVAIDGAGIAWVPYWAVDLTKGFPPQDSTRSPFYLLDVATGERLDRTRMPKALHGPAIHTTGVWAGGDDGRVRHWPLPGVLEAFAVVEGQRVTLLINTDATGDWRIDWGPGEVQQGSGRPPTKATRTVAPGFYEARIETGAGVVTVPFRTGPPDQTPDANGADGAQDPSASPRQNESTGAADEAPLPWVAPLLAVLVGALYRRRRG